MKLKNITTEQLMRCRGDMLNKGITPNCLVLSSKSKETINIDLCGLNITISPNYRGKIMHDILGMEVYSDPNIEPNTMILLDFYHTEEKQTLLQRFKLWWMKRFWLK